MRLRASAAFLATFGSVVIACSSSTNDTAQGDFATGVSTTLPDSGPPPSDSVGATGGPTVSASAIDGIKNGDESDVDCGGAAAPKCAAGKQCNSAADCADNACNQGTCVTASGQDGIQNNDETDIDCGGFTTPKCAPGKKCNDGPQCSSFVCVKGLCQTPTHDDGTKNGDESGIDCGGKTAPKCKNGESCAAGSDCTDGVCTGNICRGALSTDGVKNGDESDTDCGGKSAPACGVGKSCATAGDCADGVCTSLRCAAPSLTDGVKNGSETDVDCGGSPAAPACASGKGCLVSTDCAGGLCGSDGPLKNKCLYAPSCTGGVGAGDNCGGPNGTTNCCSTIQVPSIKNTGGVTMNAYKLDTYEVTVGRLRAYFNAVGGDPRANPPAVGSGAHSQWANSGWRASWNIRLPSGWSDVNFRLGPSGCKRGGFGDYGTTTWTNASGTKDAEGVDFDSKPIDCIDWYTLFAFCIWDGGRLPTVAEFMTAFYGGATTKPYPWGSAPAASTPNYPFNPSPQLIDYAVIGNYGGNTPGGPTYPQFFTWGQSSRYVGDRGTHIAPPGSKPLGDGAFGHADLAGNVMEWLFDNAATPIHWGAPDTDFPDPNTDPNLPWSKGDWGEWTGKQPASGTSTVWKDAGGNRAVGGGSWEGHQITNGGAYLKAWEGGVMASYQALGGRCARN